MTKKAFTLATIALLIGWGLTIASWLELCSEQCSATHNWRLFGLKFQDTGLLFFPLLLTLHIMGKKQHTYAQGALLLLAAAVGAEALFIGLQKFIIKAWCPVCLGIAASIGGAFICYMIGFTTRKTMNFYYKPLSMIMVGFVSAFLGVSQINTLEAKEASLKEKISFGNPTSPIEIYLFTDWQCPACQKLEPALPEILAVTLKDASFQFIDIDIHPETLNFAPYNLSFIINNKSKYLKLRNALTDIAKKTGTPSESEVQEAAKQLGVTYRPLNFSDVAMSIQYSKHLANEFDVAGTPTMVLVNRETKKGKKLAGSKEITKEGVQQALEKLKS